MKIIYKIVFLAIIGLSFSSCSTDSAVVLAPKNYKYLALGDSYTIGQSVCETCRFPVQLKDSIGKYLNTNDTFQVQIIATTGWTTTNLKSAIATENPTNDYDLVTLLIGVNNQYQNKPFSLYEQEFPELVTTAIQKAKGDKNNVIVVSIPDYAYTPFGNGNTTISTQIDNYNTFAENYCIANNITFINITDITRLGLAQTNLVASDGLHPSTIAYTKFVERILPKALLKINN
ncbi:SGNH/GDSL hydrolase family protein [Flavobacterium paronense]|uniref:SGNH/GDSL hydrolase family protein n=1 Tax=Flavobacterium paronense TaxID=1392775 RepID=A0ABV5GE05_9FLAO|nr:SGNH/GDSL hydrolase family protein [Flavobacterium paronense]MDN3678140.1 SGNH/GDSL hydrolase family protein [Flavobacterium paronense]